jgi:hypothetical protein
LRDHVWRSLRDIAGDLPGVAARLATLGYVRIGNLGTEDREVFPAPMKEARCKTEFTLSVFAQHGLSTGQLDSIRQTNLARNPDR